MQSPPEFTADHLFGRDPRKGLILSADDDLIIVDGSAFSSNIGWRGAQARINAETPSDYKVGLKIRDYRVSISMHSDWDCGVSVVIGGGMNYASIEDMYNMMRISNGTDEQHLLNTLNRKLDKRLQEGLS